MLSWILCLPWLAAHVNAQEAVQRVRVTTSLGAFVIALEAQRAPVAVAEFLRYVEDGHYTGTLIHRVAGDDLLEGGGYSRPDYQQKPAHEPVRLDDGKCLQNLRGTAALARSGPGPKGVVEDFYINLKDNLGLDPYCSNYRVFGRVVDGFEVIERIRVVPTGKVGPFRKNAPLTPIVIERIEHLDPHAQAGFRIQALPSMRASARG